jgi:glutamyl aminopeptidase
MFSVKDYEAAKAMVIALLTSLDREKVDGIIYGK